MIEPNVGYPEYRNIITVGIRLKSRLKQPGGTTRNPCVVCGRHKMDRIRIVMDRDGTRNICLDSCWREFFGGVSYELAPGMPGVVKKCRNGNVRGVRVNCSKCGNAPTGGIWASGDDPLKNPTWIVTQCHACMMNAFQNTPHKNPRIIIKREHRFQ